MMGIREKTINFTCNYFKEELHGLYDATEIEQSMFIVFLYYLKLNRVDLTIRKNDYINQLNFEKIKYVVEDLKKYKPLAQIIGEWEFFGLAIKVNAYTLIPRPETEELVQLIINENKDREQLSILDIGTGTGCIALVLKKNLPNAQVFAWDISDEALTIAEQNATINSLQIVLKKEDILGIPKSNNQFDIIVSNPPYITMNEKELMNKNVLDYEPHLALFVENEEPLLFYNAIADFAWNNLNEKGKLYFEINENFGQEVRRLLMDKNFKNINIVKDINKKDRIVSCTIN